MLLLIKSSNMKKIYLLAILISTLSFAQIVQVKDISSGGSSTPTNLFDYNGTLLFRAADTDGIELWKSDGTASGTVQVKNINTGTPASSSNSNPANFTIFNGAVYFSATTGTTVSGTELYKTDGTATGTVLVKDIRPGTGSSASSNPQNFLILNPTTMLFSANDGTNGTELWKTDGSTAGTSLVVDYPGTANSITWIEKVGSNAILGQIVSTTGRELYKSDGTAVNSSLLIDINPGSANGVNTASYSTGSTVYFPGNDGSTGFELWKTDGTVAGTILVKDINSGSTNSNPIRFAEANGIIYFKATGVNGEELWRTDGTAAGTLEVADINTSGNSNPDQLTVINNNLYFFAADDDLNYDLYTYNGTTLTKLYDFNAKSSTVTTNFVVLNDIIYFGADSDNSDSRELWQTDGTAAGTKAVSTLLTGSINPNTVSNITKVGDKLFFSATNTDGQELFTYTPPSLKNDKFTKLSDITIYPNPSNGTIKTNIEDFLSTTYEVYDILGKKVKADKMESDVLNLGLKRGIYFLKLTSEKQSITKKIIID